MYDHLLTKLGFCYKIQTNDSQGKKSCYWYGARIT